MPDNSENESPNTENEDWPPLKRTKLDAYWNAYIASKTEISRRVLTISSAGIGFIITIAANSLGKQSSLPEGVKVLLVAALIAFVIAVLSTIWSLWIDPKYLERAISEINKEGSSQKLESLSHRTTCFGDVGRVAFMSGVAILLVLGIATIV